MVIENFSESIIEEAAWSEPILVEGRAWRLIVEAKESDSVELAPQLSVYLNMVSIEDHLNLNLPSSTSYLVELVHPQDPAKNFSKSSNDKFKKQGGD